MTGKGKDGTMLEVETLRAENEALREREAAALAQIEFLKQALNNTEERLRDLHGLIVDPIPIEEHPRYMKIRSELRACREALARSEHDSEILRQQLAHANR